VKIYVAAVEALRKRRKTVKLRKPSKWFPEFHPRLNANVLFCRFFFNLTPRMTKLRVLVLSLPDFTDISNINREFKISKTHFHILPWLLTIQWASEVRILESYF
jgi:hypothetical protein